MQLTNQDARKRATTKFLKVYGLFALIVALIPFFICSSPSKIFMEEAEKYSEIKSQHKMLDEKTGKMTTYLSGLMETQKSMNLNPDSGLQRILNQYETDLDQEFSQFSKDSLETLPPLLKNDVSNFMVAYDAVLFYFRHKPAVVSRPTVSSVVTPTSPVKIDDKQLTEKYAKLFVEYTTVTQNNKTLAIQLKACEGKNPEAAKAGQAALVAQLQTERETLKTQMARLENELRTKDGLINTKQTQLEACLSKTPPATGISEAEKAQIVFQSIESVVRSARQSKKAVYTGMVDVLQSIKGQHPDKAKIDNKVKEIQAIARAQSTDF